MMRLHASTRAAAVIALLAVAAIATATERPAQSITADAQAEATARLRAMPASTPTPASALPQLDGRFGRATILAGSDSLPILSHGFDALNGTCNPRGWTAEDRSAVVFAHVSDRYLANRAVGTSVRLDDVGAENGRLRAPMREVNDIAVSDLGSVFFVDDQSGRSVHEGFPALDSVRIYVDLPFSTFSHRIAFDPLTGDLISGRRSGAFNSTLYRTPRAAGEGTEMQIAGGGLFPGDTTADRVALGEIQDIVVDAAGNIYFCERGQNVVRMLRQNDQRIVTLLGTGGTADSPDGVLARTADVSAPYALALDGGTLYVSESGRDRVRTVDLVTGILGSVPGFPFPGVPVRHLTVSGGALWVSGPEAIWKYESGALTRVVGTDDPSPFRPESEADLGTNYVFDNDRETDGLAPDGAGGIYFSDPHRALLLRLHADLTIEVIAGEALPVRMGARALWFGADEVSAPAEVAGWVHPRGFGSGWSQRLVSPPVDLTPHPDAVLSFDAWVEMGRSVEGNTGDAVSALVGTPYFLAVQVLGADGRWALVNARCYSPNSPYSPGFGDGSQIGTAFLGKATAHFVVEMNDHENDLIPLASPTRFRVVVQTRQFESNEDGLEPEGAGAAIVDNLSLREGTTDLIAPVDFEDGTLGGWTLSALNGSVEPFFTPIIRDLPAVEMQPALRKNFDFADPTCVWTFLSPGDTLRPGVFVRMRSPWIAAPASAESLLVVLSTKLATQNQARVLQVNARFKQTGGTRPVHHEFLGNVISSVTGADLASPFIPGLVLTYPPDPGAAPWREGPRALFEPLPGDSVQIEIRLLDLAEQLGVVVDSRPQSRLPYLDDVRVLALSTDPDGDGVPSDRDGCPAVSAAGQDADGDGCPDPTATLRHVETWTDARRPIRWALNHDGDPRIGDGSDLQAVRDAAAAWLAAPGASVPLVEQPTTPLANADALDGVNLVTWKDDVTFPPDVLAVTPTTSFTKPGAFDDRIVLPGEIVDSDLIFNPRVVYRTAGTGAIPNSVDLESVAAHELGHLLGLSHSGVPSASMFPVLQSGDGAASLEADDHAAIGAAYPGAGFASLGAITGAVTRGQTGQPIPGALVTAAPLVSGVPGVAVASDYSDETGAYALRGLAPGSYAVRIAPLDGSVPGLVPQAINARVSASAQTNFIPEWHSDPETERDDPTLFAAVAVGASAVVAGVNVVTTVDTIPPAIASVLPADGATEVAIDGTILVNFSEPIAATTISNAFSFRVAGETGRLGGSGQLLAGGTSFVFTPSDPLQFGTEYEVEFTTQLTDREQVPLAAPFVARFTTLAPPNLAISGILPRQAPWESWITVVGNGFSKYIVPYGHTLQAAFTSDSPDELHGFIADVTPTSLVIRVPSGAMSGPIIVRDVVTSEESNPFNLIVTPPQNGLPAATGAPIPLTFAPADVALSPEGHNVFAVGTQGFATINLSPTRPSFGVPVTLALRGGARVALTPDGGRAYVSRPDSGDVVEVVTDTSQAGFGQAFVRIPIGGAPDGLAVSNNGRSLFATDRGGERIFMIDTDPASPTFRSVRREIPATSAVLTGGITTHPFGRLYATTSNQGVIGFWEPATDEEYFTEIAAPATASAILSEDGIDLFAIEPLAFGSRLRGACLSECDQPAPLAVNGKLRDLVRPVASPFVFAVNSELNQIQIIDPYPATTIVGNVATGASPVAASVSADGLRMAVANFGDRSIGLYGIGDARALSRVGADPVIPGEVTTVSGAVLSPIAVPTTTVIIDGVNVSPLSAGPGTTAYVVPPLDPTETSVMLLTAGVPSNALPISVFDPIPGFAPRATGIEIPSIGCANLTSLPPTRLMQVSPDGAYLVVPRYTQECAVEFDLYEIGARGAQGFGALIRSGVVLGSTGEVRGLAYTRDGSRLWAAFPDAGMRDIDADPASPGFGTGGTFFGLSAWAVVADPLDDRMYGLLPLGPNFGVCAWNYAHTIVDSIILPGAHHTLAVSPDGRWVVVGGVDRARILDAGTMTVAATTPAHAGFTQPMERVAVSPDGRRALGVFAGGDVAVWSLEAGSFGAELYFGPGLPGGVDAIEPGASPQSLIAGCTSCPDLRHVDLAVNPPTITAAPLGYSPVALARTRGGRHLWVADRGAPTLPATLRLVSLSPATGLGLVGGGGQQALPGEPLPQPIRVRAAHPDGSAAAGVAVTFTRPLAGGEVDGLSETTVTRVTDVDGEATVTWTPPPVLGFATLTVRALGTGAPDLSVVAEVIEAEDTAAPVLTALGPADGAVGINAGTEVFARFNQRMAATTHEFLTLSVGGVTVPATHRYEDDGRLVLLRPATPFPFAASCALTVAPGAVDQQGQILVAGGATAFTIQDEPQLAVGIISPPAAPVGAATTIQGSGFSPVPSQNIVRFNGVVAPVLTATPTSLVAQVPATALTGPLTVQVGTATSNALEFVVLASPPESTAVIDTLPAKKGVFAIAVTPDGARAYVTNATSNTVAALDVQAANLLATIPVGVDPRAIALLPDGSRAYVANTKSNDVSVISTDPLGAAYHTVVTRIPVKAEPVALAVSSIGPRVLVVERGSSTMSVIDAQPGNATFDLVTDSIELGSGGVDIMISPDGGRAFIATASGFVVVDLESYVTDSVDLGSGGTDIMISPDGGLLFVLTEDGRMVVVAVAPGSPARVVDSVDLGSGGTDVMISPDGGRLYVTIGDGDEVLVFDLETSAESGGDASSSLPGPPVTLTLVATIPVGDVPVNMAADPLGRYVLVVNQGSGEVSVLGVPGDEPPPPTDPVPVALEMTPNQINLSAMGRWISVRLTVPPPYTASQIDLASVRLNGVVPLDLGGPHSANGDVLLAKVSRSALGLLVPPDSSRLEVEVTGAMADTHFAAHAVITVKRGKVTAPQGNEFVHGASTYTVRYEKSPGPTKWVALLHSFDGGASWIVDGTRLANTGAIAWNVPDVTADSALIAVVEVEDDSDPAGTVVGVLGMSSSFTILGTVGVGDAPAELSLARVVPNPSTGPVAMRFGLPRRAKVSLEVFDVQGRLVRTLVDEERAAGWHDARWDGRHRDRGITGAGIYFVRLRAEGRTMQQRVVRLE